MRNDESCLGNTLLPQESNTLRVLVVAGEASSDCHAAGLVRNLLQMHPNTRVFGMGGSELRKAGMETIVDSETAASVMGISELIGNLRKLFGAFRTILQRVDREKPQIAVLVDFPDFNLRLAKALHRRGVKILYFISPQLWAWRSGRVKLMRRYIKKIATIFPFEETFYRSHGVDAEYVGHPFLDEPESFHRDESGKKRKEFLESLGLDALRPTVALLPGSRKSEVERLLPLMLKAVLRLQQGRPGLQAVIPVASSLRQEWIWEMVRRGSGHDCPEGIVVTPGNVRELLTTADTAVVASGTATVEAALAQIPCVVVYRLAPLSYWIARLLVRGVQCFAMVNLIAGEKIVPELFQDEVNERRIALELETFLGDRRAGETVSERLSVVRKRLAYPMLNGTKRHQREGNDAAVRRAACMALSLIEPSSRETGR